MEIQRESPTEELTRLRRCLNDLASLVAIPSFSSGNGSQQIAKTLMAMLVEKLHPAFVVIQWKDVGGGPAATEVVAGPELPDRATEIADMGGMLTASLGQEPHEWPAHGKVSIAGREILMASARLGIDGGIGLVAVGSSRIDFPQQTERLILSVAASQASVAMKEARLRSEQERIAEELDQRVAQRTAELAAANAELQLQVGLLQQLPVSAWTLKPDGTPDFVNQVWLEFSGQALDFVRSHPEAWMSAVHPEDREAAAKSLWEGVHSGRGFSFETRSLRAKDGTYRWHLQQATVLRDADGKVLRFVGTTTDIDDLKVAQEELKKHERDLRLIIDTIPTQLWWTDSDGLTHFHNQRYLDYIGLSDERLQGWGWVSTIHPDDMDQVASNWQRIVDSGSAGEGEFRWRGHDGTYRWFLFRACPLRGENGNIVKWYGVLTDINDRKRAEEELRRNEALLSKAQRLSSTGSFSWCLDNDEIKFSEEAYRIFGFEPGAPISLEEISTRIHPDDIPLLVERTEAARSRGLGLDYEIRLLMPDGTIKYLHTTSNETGLLIGRRVYIGAIQDVTQRRVAQEALYQAQAELARVSRITSLGALTASMAHEINQPLSGVITNAGTCLRLLNADSPNLDGARETVRRTIRDCNRAADVIMRLRDLFGKREFALEPIDLNNVAREIIDLTSSDLQRNRVVVQFELAEDLPSIDGDRVQLQQVILNLVRNASEAMADVNDRPRQLLIKTESDKESAVRLSVRDAGIGFAEENPEKVFDSFYTTKNGGMGIGLSVSRSIIEKHQGRLWAESNDGPGATFAFSIPCGTAGVSPPTGIEDPVRT